MPKEKTITVYQYSELSEKAKEKARDWYIRASAGDLFTWDNTKDDAKNVGLILKGTNRGYMTGDFENSPLDCSTRITKEHGETCETYKTAAAYLTARAAILAGRTDGDLDGDETDKLTGEDEEFLHAILEDYRVAYEKEEEYQQSEECIAETMEANEYEFDENGRRI